MTAQSTLHNGMIRLILCNHTEPLRVIPQSVRGTYTYTHVQVEVKVMVKVKVNGRGRFIESRYGRNHQRAFPDDIQHGERHSTMYLSCISHV
jgi:hypothetical protein